MSAQFAESDRDLIEKLEPDSNAKPAFEALKGCLVWSDEVPPGLSPQGHERLNDLLAARGMIHLGNALAGLPEPYRSTWSEALNSKLSWPGFGRLSLSAKDRRYLENELRALASSADGI